MLQSTIFVKHKAILSTKVKSESHYRWKCFIAFNTSAFISSRWITRITFWNNVNRELLQIVFAWKHPKAIFAFLAIDLSESKPIAPNCGSIKRRERMWTRFQDADLSRLLKGFMLLKYWWFIGRHQRPWWVKQHSNQLFGYSIIIMFALEPLRTHYFLERHKHKLLMQGEHCIPGSNN